MAKTTAAEKQARIGELEKAVAGLLSDVENLIREMSDLEERHTKLNTRVGKIEDPVNAGKRAP